MVIRTRRKKNTTQKDTTVFAPASLKQQQFIESDTTITVFGGSAGCYDGETEYLSPNGWVNIRNYDGGKVAQWNQTTNQKEFVQPEEFIKKPCPEMYRIKSDTIDFKLSDEHRVCYYENESSQSFTIIDYLTFREKVISGVFNGYITDGKNRYTIGSNLVITAEKTYDGFKYCFTVPSSFLVMRRRGKVFISGNSGKSYVGLLRFLRYINDPLFVGYVFRKNSTDMKGGGGLFETAVRMFQTYDSRVRHTKQPMVIYFPSGATINFIGMDGQAGMDAIHGKEISGAMIDEATHLSEVEINWIISRLRTKAKMTPCIWLTCNPDPDSIIFKWIRDYYLYPLGTVIGDELVEGRPNKDTDGRVRYYLKVGSEIKWGSDREELISLYKHNFPLVDGVYLCEPTSFRFISANCHDNPPLLKADPTYVHKLLALGRVEKERLYYGNWLARQESAGIFNRTWCEIVQRVPSDVKRLSKARAYDLAGTLPSEENPDPDYTASVLISRCDDGYYYVEDCTKGRMRINDVLTFIKKTAKEDYEYYGNMNTFIPRDPNSGGKYASQQFVSKLAGQGVAVRTIPTSGGKSKLTRFEPFACVAQEGLVRVVRGDWNDTFFSELESFTGERTRRVHDDIVDATSDSFMKVSTNKELPTFSSEAWI